MNQDGNQMDKQVIYNDQMNQNQMMNQFQRQDGQKQPLQNPTDKQDAQTNQQTTINGMSLQEHALKQYYQSINNKQMMQKKNYFDGNQPQVGRNDLQQNMMLMQQDKGGDGEGSQQDQNQDLQ